MRATGAGGDVSIPFRGDVAAAASVEEEAFDVELDLAEVPAFIWQSASFGECSATCGQGQRSFWSNATLKFYNNKNISTAFT